MICVKPGGSLKHKHHQQLVVTLWMQLGARQVGTSRHSFIFVMSINQHSHQLVYFTIHFGRGELAAFSLSGWSEANSVSPNWGCSKAYLQQVGYYLFNAFPQIPTPQNLSFLQLDFCKSSPPRSLVVCFPPPHCWFMCPDFILFNSVYL